MGQGYFKNIHLDHHKKDNFESSLIDITICNTSDKNITFIHVLKPILYIIFPNLYLADNLKSALVGAFILCSK